MIQWHATFNETRHHKEDSSRASSIPQSSLQAGEFIRAEEFGTFLVEEAIIVQPVLERARRAAQSTQDRLDRVLLKLGLVAESDLAAALAKFFSLPLAEPADVPLEPVLPDVVDPEFIRRNGIIPLSVSKDKLIVGLIDPFSDEPVRALAYLTDLRVLPRIFAPAEFEKAFDALYAGSEIDGAHSDISPPADTSDIDAQRLRDMASEAPTIRLVNQIIAKAVEAHASDIHIEPTIDTVLVRYRIDGSLRNMESVPIGQRAAVTSRIKIMSNLDIAERRLPQDGRVKIAVRGVDIDFRVSTIPTAFGESVVMRILDQSRVELDLTALGFSPSFVTSLAKLMNEPNGIILVTGPTGSGKTTTLYTALKMLNEPDRKLFTVEDPVEYQLAGINQVQAQPAIGLDFPQALRSILRQDPDIVMIGEIRDLETARIAIQASLTGHLVLSSLHTNSAAATMTRLMDMGIEPYLLASTIKGIVAQRLVRRLCPHCAMPHETPKPWQDDFIKRVPGPETLGPPNIRQPHGCNRCGSTGFSGRTTIAELLLVNSDIHRLLLASASDTEIDNAARAVGMTNMYEDGIAKVWRGETTIEDILRATRVI